ncbi:hypothetical protein Tco_0357330 [Tanacetum coccineum]
MAQVHQAARGFTDAEWDDVLARVATDEDFVQQLQAGEKCSEEDLPMKLVELVNQRKKLKMRKVQSFVPMGSELEVQRLKRASQEVLEKPVKIQKTREASSLVEELVIQPLQVKYPIIDWEVYSEDTRRYWRIIRDLVKERFNTTEPTDDKEKELWVELKRLFEPDNDDILWKLQRYMHDPLVWRLYDTCGVHHVSSVRGHDIFMLVEKEYPLTRGTLGLMMVARLLVEADSEMSRELLRKIFYQANRPRQGGLLGIRGFYNLMLLVQVCAAAED